MSWLIRLYPPSWRKRYGRELEVLVEDMPGKLGVALDLIAGAAIAYRDVVRANRVLSAAGAYLHGLCVAVLLQAIAFVSMIMLAQGRQDQTDLGVGPADLVTFVPAVRFAFGRLSSLATQAFVTRVAEAWLPEIVVLTVLLLALALVLAAPRALRSLR